MRAKKAAVYAIGIDLGHISDRTALSVVERVARVGGPDMRSCRYLRTWPAGTEHGAILRDVTTVLDSAPELRAAAVVGVDVTAAGLPIGQDFRHQLNAKGFPVYTVTITGGVTSTQEGGDIRVPKRDLGSLMRLLFDKRLIQVAQSLPYRDELMRELGDIRPSMDRHDEEDVDWRTRPHDDLVFATAIACWLHGAPGQGVRRRARSTEY